MWDVLAGGVYVKDLCWPPLESCGLRKKVASNYLDKYSDE